MKARRLFHIFFLDVRRQVRRPLILSLIILTGLLIWSLSTGDAKLMTSGSSMVGGKKSWLTSEISISQILAVVTSILYSFFVAVAAGMAVLREEELNVGEILRGTPLRDSEYVWGKYLAVLVSFGFALSVHLGIMLFFFHGPGSVGREEFLGPFVTRNYLLPALIFALPNIVFVSGLSFALGYWTRRAVIVYFFPIFLGSTTFFLFWTYSPGWLDRRIDRWLMWLDPTGNRWLQGTWLEVDRGVDFYNTAALDHDLPFLLSRLVIVGLGLLAVASCHSVRVGRWARIVRHSLTHGSRGLASVPDNVRPRVSGRGLTYGSRELPGLFSGMFRVARVELRELRSSPALYLFIPLLLVQTLLNALLATGFYETPVLLTPGWLAAFEVNFLTVWLCPLLLVYAVESLQRERSSGLAEIYYSTPLKAAAIVLGKVLGLLAVVGIVLTAVLVANGMALAFQGQVSLSLSPFVLVWGLLLPTFLVWIAFVMAAWSLTGSGAATYAIGAVTFGFTLYKQFVGEMTWVGNWLLWDAVSWSDLGPLELHRKALLLNRLFVLLLSVVFLLVTVRLLARRQRDPQRLLAALRPRVMARPALALVLLCLPALAVGGTLWNEVRRGPEGDVMNERLKNYWRKNMATWTDRPVPAMVHVDLDLELDPVSGSYKVSGTYDLINHLEEALHQVPLTPGFHWQDLRWTMNGKPDEPEDRAGLAVFEPERALLPGDRLRIGFAFQARHPSGTSRNGGNSTEFVLPAGVVLDNLLSVFESRSPTLVPFVGYRSDLGIDDDNRFEPAGFSENMHEEVVEAGLAPRAFDTRIRITGPAEYTYNSVGVKVSDEVRDGLRTVVWRSDHPVRLFNVVAGLWAERRGKEGTVVYYHPEHTYNVDEIGNTLDAARRYYSAWFAPYPWSDLKLSEFANFSENIGGAGMPTNIIFSEHAGFLTRNDVRNHAAFMVTAHEAAHQWWGNILTPGDGPGGALLSEGMAHFSTLLLFEQVKGEVARMEFARRLEEQYENRRRVDMERPLARITMEQPGELVVVYNKGAWAYWMLLQEMGREPMLEGVRSFIEQWRDGRDHPLLMDFLNHMRPYAEDTEAFDHMTDQWFLDVVMPEYRLSDADRRRLPDGNWRVTVRVTNRGTGRVPVEVALVRGRRYDAEGKAMVRYRDSRMEVTLGPGESRLVTMVARFEPDGVTVDPDVHALQLNRASAEFKF